MECEPYFQAQITVADDAAERCLVTKSRGSFSVGQLPRSNGTFIYSFKGLPRACPFCQCAATSVLDASATRYIYSQHQLHAANEDVIRIAKTTSASKYDSDKRLESLEGEVILVPLVAVLLTGLPPERQESRAEVRGIRKGRSNEGDEVTPGPLRHRGFLRTLRINKT